MSYPDGNRDLVLHYVSHVIKGNELTITVKDIGDAGVLWGYSPHGIGGASRLLHHFEFALILPQAPTPKPRPVIYNSLGGDRVPCR